MATNATAITDLEGSKAVLEGRCAAASGAGLLKLLTAIQHVADEVGSLEMDQLGDADYIPQTTAFDAATADGAAFVATLKSIKAAFSGLSIVADAVDKLLTYIK